MKTRIILLGSALLVPIAANAQFDFKVDGRDVQVHSFGSQGFAYSDDNNYLTMKTSDGSFAFTDGGVNVSTNITDRFRIGAQAYSRNIGQLGRGTVTLDWGFGDYRFKDWFGIRAGKVKTVLGLYNDTQDMESLHTWALLPQAVYPLDLRASTIAHMGGDIYGEIPGKALGSFSYTAYAGQQPVDRNGGYFYNNADAGTPVSNYSSFVYGSDFRWNSKISGLIAGVSWMSQDETTKGTVPTPFMTMNYTIGTIGEHYTSTYIDYTRGRWHFAGEGRRHYGLLDLNIAAPSGPPMGGGPGAGGPGAGGPGAGGPGGGPGSGGPGLSPGGAIDVSDSGWFASAAFRVSKRIELGSYYSRYWSDVIHDSADTASSHIYDKVVTARIDLKRFWDLKIEGHFMDGHGDPYSARGFYGRSNPNGLAPNTNLLVIRTGVSF
jgi:hypothetical protein